MPEDGHHLLHKFLRLVGTKGAFDEPGFQARRKVIEQNRESCLIALIGHCPYETGKVVFLVSIHLGYADFPMRFAPYSTILMSLEELGKEQTLAPILVSLVDETHENPCRMG